MTISSSSPNNAKKKRSNDVKYFEIDDMELNEIRSNKRWMQNPKYFKKVMLSPSATMKMLNHALSGVEKGRANNSNKSSNDSKSDQQQNSDVNSAQGNGKPVEVMGLLLGKPSGEESLIVTDVFPLPVEGAETRVLADDQQVINYMIELGESIEATRKEKFMGWYHSHPFDVEVHSHCFLSSTDISTQLQWQRAEDPHGNPWLAIVVDPLRSIAKKKPEFGAFRVYPPEYAAPVNEVPDGAIIADDTARVERWGTCWNRYYALEIDYFMSSLGSNMLGILSEKFLWMNTLSSTAMLEKENKDRFADRINLLNQKLSTSEKDVRYLSSSSFTPITSSSDSNVVGASSSSSSSSSAIKVQTSSQHKAKGKSSIKKKSNIEDSVLNKSTQMGAELSIEYAQGQTLQVVKNLLFNKCTTSSIS